MKIFCCYTRAHEVLLRDYFLPSLPNDVQLNAIALEDIDGPGDFLSTEFIDCIRRKMAHIEQSIESNPGAVIGWMDVDIVMFRSFRDEVKRMMDEEDLDIVFQKEGFGKWDSEVNTGVIFMRCNDRVRRFYQSVRDKMAAEPDKNEQPVVNELLAEKTDLRWKMLSTRFAARSHGWPLDLHDAVLYHANVTTGSDGVGQKIRQFSEVNQQCRLPKHRVCVVSPEVIGPRRNSGIGTHTSHLLRMLAAQPDVEVTLLLTAEIHVETEGGWEKWFREEMNVRFVHLESQPHLYSWVGWFNYWFTLRSQQVYNFLRREAFDIVHFQDLNGDGFVSHQARHCGLAFEKTVFTVTVNGPARWAREGMKQFPEDEIYESLLNFVEGYPTTHCDLLIGPSKYALRYVDEETDWRLAPNRRVCPYMLDLGAMDNLSTSEGQRDGTSQIVFFGRLETRKGIHLFLSALELLHLRDLPESFPRKVTFVGNHAPTPLGPSEEAIPRFFAEKLPGWEYTIHSEWGQPECIEFFRNHPDVLVVLPSIVETLGYTAIECLGLGINVIGADTGAFGEVFADSERLFENNPRAIAAKMLEAVEGRLPPPRSHYDPAKAQEAWEAVHHHCVELATGRRDTLLNNTPDEPRPLVSMCLPHFNYGNYVGDQIASMAAQDYPNLEFILIDDGSSDPASREVFRQWESRYTDDPRFHFVYQENRGLCATRNRAASMAKGEFIVFCDADNISRPHMVSTLVRAIRKSGADCVSCHFAKFRAGEDGRKIDLDAYTPVGACLEAGVYVDPFGDANFIIRRDVFEKLGGFRHVPGTASEDWEFLAELVLSGYQLDVVPADLFQYREHAVSNMRVSNYYDTRMRTLHPYLKRCDETWIRNILINALGSHESRLEEKERLAKDWKWFQSRIRELETMTGELKDEVTIERGRTATAEARSSELDRELQQCRTKLDEWNDFRKRLMSNPLVRWISRNHKPPRE